MGKIDKSKEKNDKARELIDTLSSLAQTKADLMESQIADDIAASELSKTVPITLIMQKQKETHAYHSNDGGKGIVDAVTTSVNQIATGSSGDVISGISGLLSTALTAFLGSNTGSEDTIENYTVYTDGISLFRLDYKGWKRDTSGTSISKTMENVSAWCYSKSVVDVTKLDYQSFVALYQNVLQSSEPELTKDAILQQLDDLKKIYDRLSLNDTKTLNAYYKKEYKMQKEI